ncbi:MAG: lycopene cyclase family protein [Flavobacteriaceae bacterium]|nr:lycopene cyclase family protein [Flavobacteriaceae bacterium]MCY4266871.1 lycopene cyclase family protein [Flavobacteriaceae bacterium]MCY4298548.1 lycopene cyclase family protein [Flavobacteriaceae bacterium]
MKKHYDYIICGAGLSGLMLGRSIIREKALSQKGILIIEKEEKTKNDRTWCFWENVGFDDHDIVSKKWNLGLYVSKQFQKTINFRLEGYSYKMIRSEDFYQKFKAELLDHPNVRWLTSQVTQIKEKSTSVEVSTPKKVYSSELVFSSIVNHTYLDNLKKHPFLLQHFVGWYVKTEKACFDDQKMTFMDFSINQKGHTRFMYVLPINRKKALIEYTLFSKEWLPDKQYAKGIEQYLAKVNSGPYQVLEIEKNAIPMTTFPFHKNNGKRLIHIGVAGGWAKPSTGFTFYRTLKLSKMIVESLKFGKPLPQKPYHNRFLFYDKMLLKVLEKQNDKGHIIFDELFQKNNPLIILKFLSGDTTLIQELKILASFRFKTKVLFLRALWNESLSIFTFGQPQ